MIKFTKAWSPGISSATYYLGGQFLILEFQVGIVFHGFIFMVNLVC